MSKFEKQENERLGRLQELRILDTENEEVFDNITKAAANLCGASYSYISFIDEERIWIKSQYNLNCKEVPREGSPCSLILEKNQTIILNQQGIEESHSFFKHFEKMNLKFYLGVPLALENGKMVGVLGILHDQHLELNQQKTTGLEALASTIKSILSLRLTRLNFNEIEQVAKIGHWYFDLKTQRVSWSDQMHRHYGLTPSENIPSYQEIINRTHPEDIQRLEQQIFQCSKDGKPYQIFYRLKSTNGEDVWFEARGKAVKDHRNNIVGITGISFNVNEEYRAKKETEQTQRFLRATLNNLPAIFYAKNTDGQFISVNREFESFFKVNENDVIGKSNHELFPKETADQFRINDLEIINTKQVQESQESALNADGKETFFHSIKFPFINSKDEVYATGGISLDITEKLKAQTEAEQEKLKLIQASKLASLGEMAAGVGHEINNPLSVISLCNRMLMKGKADPAKTEDAHAKIKKSVERISSIVHSMKKFSRKNEKKDVGNHFINKIVDECIVLSTPRLKNKDHRIELTTTVEEIEIQCDEVQIEQIIINLIGNAIDAIEDLEKPWIKIKSTKEKDYIKISIIDSGKGIKEDIVKSLFEPFFTTKITGKGTGLGLSISANIAQDHGGEINYELTEDGHTSFYLRLPA